MHRQAQTNERNFHSPQLAGMEPREALYRVLALPTVASKSFLITIGDRSITGQVARDQMVGPWQVPVANAAVTTSSFDSYCGEAMAMGERTPVAVLDAPASGRMAVGEAITNIASAPIARLGDIKLSANWMVAAGYDNEDAGLYKTVQAVGMELCPQLGICIPVGKDSMSMRTVWQENGQECSNTAPLSLIVSAFAPVTDVRKTVTPQLQLEGAANSLLLIDLGRGRNRLGGSALEQVFRQIGSSPADLDDAEDLKVFFTFVQTLLSQDRLLAYHDRSDGGLATTLVEMAFASHCGFDIDLGSKENASNALAMLFNEELGAVIQVEESRLNEVEQLAESLGLGGCLHRLGKINTDDRIRIAVAGEELIDESRIDLQRTWSETSYRIQAMRDNADCAREEYDNILDADDPGLRVKLSFNPEEDVTAPFVNVAEQPKVAVLREQGVNGQVEMAAAFHRARFDAFDVHMSDLAGGRGNLARFDLLVACGGFSYGDVLGAGGGWAKSILFNDELRKQFENFSSDRIH